MPSLFLFRLIVLHVGRSPQSIGCLPQVGISMIYRVFGGLESRWGGLGARLLTHSPRGKKRSELEACSREVY